MEGRCSRRFQPTRLSSKAIDALSAQIRSVADYHAIVTANTNGMIVGDRRHRHSPQSGWRLGTAARSNGNSPRPSALTVLDLSGRRRHVARTPNKVTRNYFIVDDSHLGVWQYDSNYVYMPLDRLAGRSGDGRDRRRRAIDETASQKKFPARRHRHSYQGEIRHRSQRRTTTDGCPRSYSGGRSTRHAGRAERRGGFCRCAARADVKTWQDEQRLWINAVENEKLLTVVLFAIMCIVAIFLIFCIFYMIVVEKTRDIGIIKSVGATSAGVAGIFLGYGLVIGIIGALMGMLSSYLLVHYINELHAWLGRQFHVQIWNPQVYLFDKIPNEMSSTDIFWIIPIAILASVLGALIPAIRAARMNPGGSTDAMGISRMAQAASKISQSDAAVPDRQRSSCAPRACKPRLYQMGDEELTILRNLDLTLLAGDFVAIEGRSGSGKSTLLHILGALDAADGGSIEYQAKDIAKMSGAARSRLRNTQFGFVFQFYHLLPELNVLENTLLVGDDRAFVVFMFARISRNCAIGLSMC